MFKHMSLPAFDAGNPQHVQVAQLSLQAHQTYDTAARAAVVAQIEPLNAAIIQTWVNRP